MSAGSPMGSSALLTTPAHGGPPDFAARLLAILGSVDDVTSSSDEVELACTGWHDSHHLSSARANVLRAITVPAESTVLEIGSGGGAVTRYLGETYRSVDAIEPSETLAEVARRRCVDLTSVEVRSGWIDDIPAGTTYDLVVAIDALEEVARRGGDLPTFVARCRSLLTPAGVLVVAADNADGVRFLAGDAPPILDPDDPRRCVSVRRDELDDAARSAGLLPTVLSAFPDHRTTRTLFDHDALSALAPELLTALPSFPSRPFDGDRAPVFPEGDLWSSAVDDGSARHAANGLVMVASAGGVEAEQVATYWSVGRRAAVSATNRVLDRGDGTATVERSHTFTTAISAPGPLTLRPHTESVVYGTPLTQLLAEASDIATARSVLQSWSDLVDASTTDGAPLPWDLIPRNVVRLEDGTLVAFDQEWQLDATPDGADLIRARGAFWLAYDLLFTGRRRPGWLPGRTLGEAADVLLRLARPASPADWNREFVDRESLHMAHVWPTDRRHTLSARARRERNNMNSLSNTPVPEAPDHASGAADPDALRELVDSLAIANADLRAENEALRLQQRHLALVHRDHVVGLAAETESLRDTLARKQRESRRHKERAIRLQKQLTELRASTTWRAGRLLVRPFAVLGRMFRR